MEAISMSFLTMDAELVRNERAPFTTVADLRGKPDVLQTMLKHRVNYLVQRSILKLQENVQKTSDPLEGWNDSQVHYLQNLGFAYGEYFFADVFMRKVVEMRPVCVQTADLLSRLYELFVLSKIEEDLSTFRDHDYLTTEQAWMIKETVVKLTHELGESSVRIIDSVAFPDQIVGSVLGNSDGQMYKHFADAVEKSPDFMQKPGYAGLLKDLRRVKD